jgi:hypothetical protein
LTYQVFLSSTRIDLAAYRARVYEALIRSGLVPLAMESFMARTADATEVSLAEVRDCHLFLGVYAWRYGHIPEGSQISITEQEYREARRLKKECLLFLVDEGFDWPPEMRETGDGAARLAAFKKELQRDAVVKTFTTPESLVSFVDASLIRWLQSQTMASMEDFLGLMERLCAGELREWETSGLLDLGLKWHDRPGGPLSSPAAPRDLTESGLADRLRERSRILLAGRPGSGKTLALWLLSRELIAGIRSGSDSRPIPVRLSLIAWREDQSLADYLVSKLAEDYGRTVPEARLWVETGRLFLLLDDLDRLTREQQESFAAQLRELTGSQRALVVASRQSSDESDPDGTPGLQAEAVLRPLGPEEVDAYLAAGGEGRAALRQAVRERPPLRELARSPLLLLMMIKTWRDAPAGSVDAGEAGLTEEELAARYVKRMEEDAVKMEETTRKPALYPWDRTLAYLAWLSRTMRDHRMTRFEIEKLQPAWLSSPFERFLYSVLSRAAGGGLLMLLPALVPGYQRLFPAGLVMGALAGGVDFLSVWRLPASRRAGAALLQTAVRGALIAAVAFAGLWRVAGDAIHLFGPGLFVAAAFGVLFGSRPAGPREDVRFFENVRRGFSARGAWAGAGLAAVLTLLVAALVNSLVGGLKPLDGLLLVPFLALAGFVLGGFLWGTGSVLELRRKPNLGLRTILRHARGIFWRTALCTLAPAGIVAAALWNRHDSLWQISLDVLATVLLTGLAAGLWFSGLDALQHWILRGLLSATGRFPWRWVRFLDHAVARGLLLCIEGGYEPPFEPVREFFERLGEPSAGVPALQDAVEE